MSEIYWVVKLSLEPPFSRSLQFANQWTSTSMTRYLYLAPTNEDCFLESCFLVLLVYKADRTAQSSQHPKSSKSMLVLLSVIIAYFRATCASQTYLNIPNLQNNGGGTPSFSRIDDIRSISTTNHTTLWHPSYPNYSVRIKQDGGKFCDDTVK